MQKCLLRGGQVLTLHGQAGGTARQLDILVEGDRITSLGPNLAVPDGATVFDARGKLIIPGLVNAHLHSSEMFFRGRYERMGLETWLNYAYPFFAAKPIALRLLYLRSMLVAIESLRGGVTMISDDFFDPPRHDIERLATVFQAYGDAGIRANVSSGLMNLPYLDTLAFGRDVVPPDVQRQLEFPLLSADDYVAYCAEVFRHLHGHHNGRLRFMLAPSGPQRCTPDLMLACRDMAKVHGVPYHTHVLETRVQAVTGQRHFGGSLVKYMDDLGLLGPEVLMAHAVWITDDDIERMTAAGVSVSYNAIANLKLGSGLCPVRKLLKAGVNVALGTDGASSNDTMRIFDVMRVAVLAQSLQGDAPETWPSAEEVIIAATIGGAKAALLDHETGSLSPGKKADLTFLDLTAGTSFTPLSDVARQLVYCENGSSVTDVMIDGAFVLRAGRLTRIDEAAVLEEIRALMPGFLAEHAEVEKANTSLLPYFEELRRRCINAAQDNRLTQAVHNPTQESEMKDKQNGTIRAATITLGTVKDTIAFWSFPNNTSGVDYFPDQTIENTVLRYIEDTARRDNVELLPGTVSEVDGSYVLTLTGADAEDYEPTLRAFIQAGTIGLNVSRQVNTEGKWNAIWRFMLPVGLAMKNHVSVELLHFPPEYVLERDRDYLLANTIIRWAECLILNGADSKNIDGYQTTIDIAPIGAPSNAGTPIEEALGNYAAYSPYINTMLENWTQAGAEAKPLVAFGSPVRRWLHDTFLPSEPFLSVLDAGNIVVSGRTIPFAIANHPSFFYNRLSDIVGELPTPEEYEELAGIMRQDLICARWQVILAENPAADPLDTMGACIEYYDTPGGARIICEQVYFQGFDLPPEQSEQYCARVLPRGSYERSEIERRIADYATKIGAAESTETVALQRFAQRALVARNIARRVR